MVNSVGSVGGLDIISNLIFDMYTIYIYIYLDRVKACHDKRMAIYAAYRCQYVPHKAVAEVSQIGNL